jgi:hypothetical protein
MNAAPENDPNGDKTVDWAELSLEKFGSVEAIEQTTPEEDALERALRPFERKALYTDPVTKTVSAYIEYRGMDTEPMQFSELPEFIIAAVSSAYAVPGSLRGVLREYMRWDELGIARHHVCGWVMPLGVIARQLILEEILYVRPAATLDDVSARVEWWKNRATYEFDLGSEIHIRLSQRLQDDLAAIGQAYPDRAGGVGA